MKVEDLTEVPDEPTSTLVPEGTYAVIVTDAEEKTSSKGTPGIGLDLEITEGSEKGRAVWDTAWVTEKAMWRVKKVLSALKYEIPEGEFDLNTADLIGRRAFVSVEHEEYDGKTRARVTDFMEQDGWDPADIVKPEAKDDGIPF
jgi:hypothetical protein